LPVLEALGFAVEEFGADTFLVSALPAGVPSGMTERLLLDIAAAVESAGRKGADRVLLAETVARAACRTAVRSGTPLTPAEVQSLVAELAQTEMPYTCPHGRPALLVLTFRELDRKFGRG